MKKLLLSFSFATMLISLTPFYGISKNVSTTPSIRQQTEESVLITATNNIITVQGANATVKIYDLLGREVKSKKINGKAEIKIDLKGIYLVKVKANGVLTTKKVIVTGAMRAI